MYQVDEKGFFGKFGGAYVPEILYKCVTELQQAYKPIIESEEFKKEYRALLKDYVGRPSPLYYAKRMSEKYGCQLYLKREDLNHTGAHKINNTIGQILMAKKMGKTRYDMMEFVIKQNNNQLSEEGAMNLLNGVSQAETPGNPTSHTQWSVVYNLSQRKATVCVNRDYKNKFTFNLK